MGTTEQGDRVPTLNDFSWWLQFGARVEALQHVSSQHRGQLIRGLRSVHAQCGTGEIRSWFFDANVRLGLFDEAWQIWALTKLAASYDDNPRLYGEFKPPSPEPDNRLNGDFALWILGRAPRPSPPDVLAHDRDLAFEWLSMPERENGRALSELLGTNAELGSPDRYRSLNALTHSWGSIHAREWVAKIALDANDPFRPGALLSQINPPGFTQQGRFKSLEVLTSVARKPRDPARVYAVQWLGFASAVHSEALRALSMIAAAKRHPARAIAFLFLARKPDLEVLECLQTIAEDSSDPAQGAAIWALWQTAEAGSDAASATLTAIGPDRYVSVAQRLAMSEGDSNGLIARATDPHHPEREFALWALRFPAMQGRTEAIQCLAQAGIDQYDPMRAIALWGLHWTAEEGHAAAVEALNFVARRPQDPMRYLALWALRHVPGRAEYAALDTIARVAADTLDPGRHIALWFLAQHLLALPDRVLDLMANIAMNADDPAHSEAVSTIGSAAMAGNPRALEILGVLAENASGEEKKRVDLILARLAALSSAVFTESHSSR